MQEIPCVAERVEFVAKIVDGDLRIHGNLPTVWSVQVGQDGTVSSLRKAAQQGAGQRVSARSPP